ncbi:MAG: cell division protein, partial [Methanobacteriota archaeon]
AEINREIVRRFGLLARAGETAFQTGERVGENVVDASEVLYTIGRGGITSLGYASERIKKEGLGGFFKRKKPEFGSMGEAGKATRIIGLVRRAVRGKLTIECDHTSAERALVLVSGPPEYLTRRGTDKARKWLEDEIVGSEIRGGDYPIPGADAVAVVVALSGLTEVPRIKEMFEHASEVKEKLEKAHEMGKRRFDDLMEKGDVDTLF